MMLVSKEKGGNDVRARIGKEIGGGEKGQKYVKNLMEFMDPYKGESSIKPIMKYLLNIPKGTLIEIKPAPDLLWKKLKLPKPEPSSVNIDLLDLFDLYYHCLTTTSPMEPLTTLYSTLL